MNVLFQLTADEVRLNGQTMLFNAGKFDGSLIESYLFMALELREVEYTRTQLAKLTRVLNRVFRIPSFVIFRHGTSISVAVARRRINKRDGESDVLEKITLIKDVNFREPHPAHLRVLQDLHLPALLEGKVITQFVELERMWGKVLDVDQLNRAFFKELSQWFFWALHHPNLKFPKDAPDNQQNLIRLITRLIFVWFLKEKKLVPEMLFTPQKLRSLLNTLEPNSPSDGTYYQAILQNLFFATLNTEMGDGRQFKDDSNSRNNPAYMVHNLYRYRSNFQNPDLALEQFKNVPFLNGGLFECLDREANKDTSEPEQRIDGFSDRPERRAVIPNELFFSDDDKRKVALSDFEGKSKPYNVRGILEILGRYKFTVTENTPVEEEVALDPELLGKVFENLLAAYNEETKETARKQTGSFYTPRDVVDFMVDEALIAHLHHALAQGKVQVAGTGAQAPMLMPENDPNILLSPAGTPGEPDHLERKLRDLLSYREELPAFSEAEKTALIAAIDRVTILDPACGSGAFPMGVLQKLVFVLGKLDPKNARWQAQQRARLEQDIKDDPEIKTILTDLETIRKIQLEDIKTTAERDAIQKLQDRIKNLEDAFDLDLSDADYARKLYLIENCIFGVDIQPIAVQIAKLRCFISLVVDQKPNETRKNRGILPLPNLETKFVAANSLLPMGDDRLIPTEIKPLEQELEHVRHEHFRAKNFQKKKALRNRDAQLRRQIAKILEGGGWGKETANRMAAFDPYNQNTRAPFFDTNWMFGLHEGFDIVIGNPPYVRHEKIKDQKADLKTAYGAFFVGTADLFVYFFKRSLDVLKPGGHLSFICSNKYFRSGYGETLRKHLLGQTRVRQIIDFGDEDVFTAIAYPSVVLFQKTKPQKSDTVRVLAWGAGMKFEEFRDVVEEQSFSMPQASLKTDGWRIERGNVLELLEKIRAAGEPLGKYVGGRFYRGVLTGLNEAFVVDRSTRDQLIANHPSSEEVLKPFLRGRDVKRWTVNFEDQFLLKIESSENKKYLWSNKPNAEAEQIFAQTYPAIYKRFNSSEFREGLINRADQGQYFWELRSCAYWHEFENPKIMYQEIATYQAFAWEENHFYSNNKTFIIPDGTKYLLALLNSKITLFMLNYTVQKLQGDAYAMQAIYLEKIPIAKASSEIETTISKFVNFILQLKASTHPKEALLIAYLEQLIDALVYELYLPDVLHKEGRHPARVIGAVHWPATPTLEELVALLETVFDPQHEVRKLVFYLGSIPEIRIIEGKDQA